MLTITKLKGAEYLISSVADGMEDYYMGAGEAPGVWRGRWAAGLGLEGVVEADVLRSLVNGQDPNSGEHLLTGHRERTVRAIDVTLSVPKSVSLLWAFGTPETAAVVSIAVVEATEVALGFLEERAAAARVQQGGVRRRVDTDGFAVATFAHRTSRAGDPQLHTHCLIPNIVRRDDGKFVAFDANPLHTWAKATGTVFLNELERLLTARLGMGWGPERNGCREIVGLTREQLRAFSKRTVAIEARLEADGELVFPTARDRMRADDRASLATREPKDTTLTPERLRELWNLEAIAVGLEPGAGVDDLALGRQLDPPPVLDDAVVFSALVDPQSGLCARDSRFGEAHVVERVAAISGGRLDVEEIVEVSRRFLASDLVVRLAPAAQRRRPAEWSTVEHRALEDRLLTNLQRLATNPGGSIDAGLVDAAIAAEPKPLGGDQSDAVRVLCGGGASVRMVLAPAGYGKTTALRAAARAQQDAERSLVVLATTHKAVGELRAVGLDAQTIAGFLAHRQDEPLPAGTTVVVDEMSQVGTRHAAALLAIVVPSRDAQLWCVGDAHQGQSVAASGLVSELERLAVTGRIPVAILTENRRQQDQAERVALERLRGGDVEVSQQIRAAHGWEHEHDTVAEARDALAMAAVADVDRLGVEHVAVLAVSHADCEDLADRVRAIRMARGELRGPALSGPGWGLEPRTYAAGDRVLIHTNLKPASRSGLRNGTTGTVLAISSAGAEALLDDGRQVLMPASLMAGSRPDGTPNVSHAWARTVDGAQGGTWRQVHLLGTPALDRYTGYVGQSRGQLPTHTWNTRPDADYPAGLLADRRSPSEVVADAMHRGEAKTFAADDDPWILDRQLRAERDQHAAIVASRPPDRSHELDRARDQLARADAEHRGARDGLAYREAERDRLGPLARLRRGGRDEITRADQALAGAQRRLARANDAVQSAFSDVAHHERAVTARAMWDQRYRWRLTRIGEIDDTLAHHWADVVLRAVRADDPLAFGIQALREARATYEADRARLRGDLPPDRREPLARAEIDLARCQQRVCGVEQRVHAARAALDEASQRRWGRKDKPAVERTTAELRAAETTLAAARHATTASARRVTEEQHAVEARNRTMARTARSHARLTDAICDLDLALDLTRPQRIAAAVTDPSSDLWSHLGPPPTTRGGLAAWCGIAERLETGNDRNVAPTSVTSGAASRRRLQPGALLRDVSRNGERAELLDNAQAIMEAAGAHDPAPARGAIPDRTQWQDILERVHDALPRRSAGLDVTMGIEL